MDIWSKTAAWALGGTAVFSSMHVADELWSRWDIGESMVTSGAFAGVVVAVPTIVTLLALAGIVLGRRWGLALGAVLGVYALWPPLTHVLDTHEMTAYRWGVEAMAVAFAIVLIVATVREFVVLRSAGKPRTAGQPRA